MQHSFPTQVEFLVYLPLTKTKGEWVSMGLEKQRALQFAKKYHGLVYKVKTTGSIEQEIIHDFRPRSRPSLKKPR